jgi:hypothetical protein
LKCLNRYLNAPNVQRAGGAFARVDGRMTCADALSGKYGKLNRNMGSKRVLVALEVQYSAVEDKTEVVTKCCGPQGSHKALQLYPWFQISFSFD